MANEKIPKITWRQDILDVLTDVFASIPGTRPGKMFGAPGYYVGKKLSACLYEDGLALKLPEVTVKRLIYEGYKPFVPYGKTMMKEWIYIEHDMASDYFQDMALFLESVEYLKGHIV